MKRFGAMIAKTSSKRSILILLFTLTCIILTRQSILAQDDIPPSEFIWQLARWDNAETVCTIVMESSVQPTTDHVRSQCPAAILEQWINTPTCENFFQQKKAFPCEGLFIRSAGKRKKTDIPSLNEDQIEPEPRIQVSFPNCTPNTLCNTPPQIQFTSVFPLAETNQMRFSLAGFEHECNFSSCVTQLPFTNEQGIWLEYWEQNKHGAHTLRARIKYRVIPLEEVGFQFDVISKYHPQVTSFGSDLWDVFPPFAPLLGKYAQAIAHPNELKTNQTLHLLCKHLIFSGKVNSAQCEGFGFLANGNVNGCGIEQCHEPMGECQNQWDEFILKAALSNNVPPRLLKGIIAIESQFIKNHQMIGEFGLACITFFGLDMALTWNRKLYRRICYQSFPQLPENCAIPYEQQRTAIKAILMGACYQQIGTEDEFELIGAVIVGSAAQTAQILRNTSDVELDQLTDYDSLWKFTTVNYTSGSGCLQSAIKRTARANYPLTWEYVQKNFSTSCRKGVEYTERVFAFANQIN